MSVFSHNGLSASSVGLEYKPSTLKIGVPCMSSHTKVLPFPSETIWCTQHRVAPSTPSVSCPWGGGWRDPQISPHAGQSRASFYRTHTHTHTRTHAHTQTHMHTHAYTHAYTHAHTEKPTGAHDLRMERNKPNPEELCSKRSLFEGTGGWSI